MSWQWRMMQNLKNWLAISKSAWGIWRILTRAIENLRNSHFNVPLLSKVYIYCLSQKSTEELSFMKLKRDTKFGKESTYRFKIYRRNLTNFGLSTRKELSYKNWRGTDLWFEKWREKFGKFSPEINE